MKTSLLFFGLLAVSLHAFGQNFTSNLVGHWKLNGNLNDAASNNNMAVGFGGFGYTTGADGSYNGAVSLDGVDDYFYLPNIAAYNMGTGDYSVALWLKFTSLPGDVGVLWYTSTYPSPATHIRIDINPYTYSARTSPAQDNHYTPANLNDNNWHHLVFTRSGLTTKIYYDGTLSVTNTWPTVDNVSDGQPIHIGRNQNASFPYWFQGSLDNYRYYSRALTAADVSALKTFELTLQPTSYTWNVASGDWSDQNNWNPIGVPGAGDDATVNNGGTVTLTANTTIQNLTLVTSSTIAGDFDLNISGNLNIPAGANTFSGTGTVAVAGIAALASNANLTLSQKNMTLNGGGTIGNSNYFLTNGSVLTNAVGSTLSMNNSTNSFSRVSGTGTFVNLGTLSTNYPGLRIESVFTNSGTLSIGWYLQLMANSTHTNATGNISSGSDLIFASGAHTFSNCNFIGAGNFLAKTDLTFPAGNTMTSKFKIESGTFTDGAGIQPITFEQRGGTYNRTVGTAMNCTNFTMLVNLAGGTCDGNFDINVSGVLSMDAMNGFSPTLSGTGTVTVAGMANFASLNNGHNTNISEKTVVCNGGALMRWGNITLSNAAILRNSVGSTFNFSPDANFGSQARILGSGDFENLGTLAMIIFTLSEIAVNFTNSGTLNIENGGTVKLSGTSNSTGTVNITTGSFLQINSASGLNHSGATFINNGEIFSYPSTGALNFTGNTQIFSGTGLVQNMSISNSSTVNLAGSQTINYGDLNISGTLAGTGVLLFNPNFTGNFTNTGTISPGINNIGTLSISIDNIAVPISTLNIDLAQGNPVQKDLLTVTGDVNFTGATLNVTETQCIANGSYDIISYTGTRTGSFATLNMPPGYSIQYVNAGKKVRLIYVDPPPTIICPSNISVNTDVNLCTASNVTLGNAMANDNCPGVGIMNNAPSVYPIAQTMVMFTATDSKNQTATCTQTVTVVDAQMPLITCPSNAVVNTNPGVCSAAVMVSNATATDNCGVQGFANNGFSSYPVGVTIVAHTATDVHGNTATCNQTVTVLDSELPIITCPANVTVNNTPGLCTATLLVVATATDNCTVNVGSNAPATFPVGMTTVTHTATDASGNTATCAQTVTVVDNQPPVITCPVNLTRTATTNLCTWPASSLGTATTTDNCGVASTVHNIPALVPVGINVYTYTVTDVNGNTATCNRTITVRDLQNPVITCPGAVTATTGAGLCTASGVSIGMATATDNCAVATITSNAAATFALGNTTVTWTATDVNARTSTCTQTVTVVDNQPPGITCPADKTLNANAGLCSSSTGPGVATATDNCTVTVAHNAVLPFAVGVHTVTHTATDAGGNTVTCTQTVTVNDLQNPVITSCPAAATATTAAGSCTAPVSIGTATATDNCGIGSISNNAPPLFPAGTNIVIWTATDVNGRTATCTQTVTVTPNAANVEICTNSIDDDCDGLTDEPLDIALTYTNTQPACNGGLGTVRVNPPNPVTGYTYLWNNGSTTRTVPGVPAGTYTVAVTRTATGCSIIGTNTLLQPLPFTITMAIVNVKCAGGSTGSATATVTGSNTGKTFLWSTGSTLNKIENMPAGTYGFTVTDAKGCTASTTATITEPTPLLLSHTIVPVTGNKYRVTLTGSGGTPYPAPNPYRYCRVNGAACTYALPNVFTGLLPNTTYEFRTRDVNLCVTSIMVTTPSTMPEPKVFDRDIVLTDNRMDLYPNPASDELRIGIAVGDQRIGSGRLSILDIFGKKILEKKVAEDDFSEGVFKIQLDGRFADGLYLVQFREESGRVLVGKFEVVRK